MGVAIHVFSFLIYSKLAFFHTCEQGVSGAAGDEDEYAALKGVWDSGLAISTWPLEHSCTTAQD